MSSATKKRIYTLTVLLATAIALQLPPDIQEHTATQFRAKLEDVNRHQTRLSVADDGAASPNGSESRIQMSVNISLVSGVYSP